MFEDTCAFTCNDGFDLVQESNIETCLANGSWNGSDPICVEG